MRRDCVVWSIPRTAAASSYQHTSMNDPMNTRLSPSKIHHGWCWSLAHSMHHVLCTATGNIDISLAFQYLTLRLPETMVHWKLTSREPGNRGHNKWQTSVCKKKEYGYLSLTSTHIPHTADFNGNKHAPRYQQSIPDTPRRQGLLPHQLYPEKIYQHPAPPFASTMLQVFGTEGSSLRLDFVADHEHLYRQSPGGRSKMAGS